MTHTKHNPLPLEPPGYWKHPPLPTRPAVVHFEPAGYWKHPPAQAPAHIHAATTAGMAGWQIALLIAVVLIAAVVIVSAARRIRQAERPHAAAA